MARLLKLGQRPDRSRSEIGRPGQRPAVDRAPLSLDAGQVAVRVGGWAMAVSGADAVTVEVVDGNELVCHASIGAPAVVADSRRAIERVGRGRLYGR